MKLILSFTIFLLAIASHTIAGDVEIQSGEEVDSQVYTLPIGAMISREYNCNNKSSFRTYNLHDKQLRVKKVYPESKIKKMREIPYRRYIGGLNYSCRSNKHRSQYSWNHSKSHSLLTIVKVVKGGSYKSGNIQGHKHEFAEFAVYENDLKITNDPSRLFPKIEYSHTHYVGPGTLYLDDDSGYWAKQSAFWERINNDPILHKNFKHSILSTFMENSENGLLWIEAKEKTYAKVKARVEYLVLKGENDPIQIVQILKLQAELKAEVKKEAIAKARAKAEGKVGGNGAP